MPWFAGRKCSDARTVVWTSNGCSLKTVVVSLVLVVVCRAEMFYLRTDLSTSSGCSQKTFVVNLVVVVVRKAQGFQRENCSFDS